MADLYLPPSPAFLCKVFILMVIDLDLSPGATWRERRGKHPIKQTKAKTKPDSSASPWNDKKLQALRMTAEMEKTPAGGSGSFLLFRSNLMIADWT